MGFRVSFFFEMASSKSSGWSENFWNSSTDLSQVVTQAGLLRPLITAAKGDQTLCKKIRISVNPGFRQVEIINVNVIRGGTSYPADYPTTKLQIQLKDGTRTTTQWFGGIIDAVVNTGGFYLPIPARRNEMNAFIAGLANGGNNWSLYGIDRTAPRTPISGFDPATGIVTTGAAHGLVNGDRVRISRGAGNTAINGLWRVSLLTTTTFSLNFWVASTVPLTKSNVYVQKQSYAYTKITSGKVANATKHNVGRPTDLASGKPKKKRAS